jgi:hypothetical protein
MDLQSHVSYVYFVLYPSRSSSLASCPNEVASNRFRNPELGLAVRTFRNNSNDWNELEDASMGNDAAMVINAARNMIGLSTTYLTPNPLAFHIISNLQMYPQLRDLTIQGLDPEEHIWDLTPTSLTSLKWEVPFFGPHGRSRWATARHLINVALCTCPSLESLDIIINEEFHPADRRDCMVAIRERIGDYQKLEAAHKPRLTFLRHFGF